MSKYEDLSDIDLDLKEVYETSDTEESFNVQESLLPRRDSISDAALDLSHSRSVFETKMIDAHVTDFSDRIDRMDQSYETYEVKETVANRISRIRKELEELEDEVDGDGDGDEQEVKRLMDLFHKLNKKTKDKKLNVLRDLKQDTTEGTITISGSVTDPHELIELDKRLSNLEKTIGEPSTTTSLHNQINNLFRKFKLLSNDSESLIKITNIIDEVNLKFEKSITTRRGMDIQNELDDDTKLNGIYTKFVKCEEFQEDLPYLIKRLESLNDVHLRTAGIVKFTEEMEMDLVNMAKDMEAWEVSLGDLETKLNEIATNFETTKDQK